MRDENILSPTYIAISQRKQWSDEHVFEETDLSRACGRCGKRRSHGDHCTREQDKAATMAWKDNIFRERDG